MRLAIADFGPSASRRAVHFENWQLKMFQPGRLSLKGQLHSLSRSAHTGIVVARFLHYLVDAGIVMVGVMVKQDEFLGAAFHHDLDGFAPMAVSPSALVSLVFLRQVLSIVDQNV